MEIANHEFKLDQNGLWVFKASQINPFNSKGILKQKFKEMPRYDVIIEYEDYIKKEYEKNLKQAVKRMSDKLINFK